VNGGGRRRPYPPVKRRRRSRHERAGCTATNIRNPHTQSKLFRKFQMYQHGSHMRKPGASSHTLTRLSLALLPAHSELRTSCVIHDGTTGWPGPKPRACPGPGASCCGGRGGGGRGGGARGGVSGVDGWRGSGGGQGAWGRGKGARGRGRGGGGGGRVANNGS